MLDPGPREVHSTEQNQPCETMIAGVVPATSAVRSHDARKWVNEDSVLVTKSSSLGSRDLVGRFGERV